MVWMPYGRQLVALIVAAVMAGALLVAFVRAVIEQLRAEKEKKLRRQPPLPLPPADLRGRPTPPALTGRSDGDPQKR
jgi:hypothetical protein